jgi:hypothetical protein
MSRSADGVWISHPGSKQRVERIPNGDIFEGVTMPKHCVAIVLGIGLLALMSVAVWAEIGKATTVNGVLIDNACATKFMAKDDPQAAAAAEHPKSCLLKEYSAASGYAVISGKRLLKFDDNGNKLAKNYLAQADFKTDVAVDGTEQADGTLAVTAINAAPALAAK